MSKADSIRNASSYCESNDTGELVKAIREVAAQLADVNENLAKIFESLASNEPWPISIEK